MTCQRLYSIFTRNPLTYESLKSRCVKFANFKTHRAEDLKNYIIANKKLQRINSCFDPQIRNAKLKVDLGFTLHVSNSELERELTKFSHKYRPLFIASDDVVNSYILNAKDITNMFDLVQENFQHQVAKQSINLSPVTTLIQVLLRQKDYQGCFKLVDATLKNQKYLIFKRHQVLCEILRASFLSVTFTVLCMAISCSYGIAERFIYQDWWNHLFMSWPLIPFSVIPTIICVVGFQWLKTVNFSRISWRPHTSVWHRILHFEEALLVNKIVTYFEENHEVNVKNFHVSELRHLVQPSVVDNNDYELHLPDNLGSLAQDFRSELYQRKLVWSPLREEGMFLDFWISHGDSYEWVEPDQDPAEIQMLRPVKKE